jgi:hypothetical protein
VSNAIRGSWRCRRLRTEPTLHRCNTPVMKYLTFVANKNVLKTVAGSSQQDVDRLEHDLGIQLPLVLREYCC